MAAGTAVGTADDAGIHGILSVLKGTFCFIAFGGAVSSQNTVGSSISRGWCLFHRQRSLTIVSSRGTLP